MENGSALNSTREDTVTETNHITNETLLQSAHELLEDYYEQRDTLIKQIRTFEDALLSARDDLKILNKKNRQLLKQSGAYKTQDEKVFDFIRKNEGLLYADLKLRLRDEDELSHISSPESLGGLVFDLCNRGVVTKKEGRFFVTGSFKPRQNIGINDIVREFLKKGPATKKDIKEYIKNHTTLDYNAVSIANSVNFFITANKLATNKTYKGQRNCTYTWIGETD